MVSSGLSNVRRETFKHGVQFMIYSVRRKAKHTLVATVVLGLHFIQTGIVMPLPEGSRITCQGAASIWMRKRSQSINN
jgi:hypothetical protein